MKRERPAVTPSDRPGIERKRTKVDGRTTREETTVYFTRPRVHPLLNPFVWLVAALLWALVLGGLWLLFS